ncbi:MAG: hypothetical protein EHM21_02020 [Chloroflexi bacterium]|nr:MAG: hypothetical protein EHM21_02020 [Chloroflexota bacterium]
MATKIYGIGFPAILDGLGPDRVMAEAAGMGAREFIACSIIYRGYRLVMPRSPRQIYQLETGVTFYPADESIYRGSRIQPVSTRDFSGRDLFMESARAAERNGITLSAWVSCFANGRVAELYPDTAVQNLYGARDRLFLCFNNPDTIQYCLNMVKDLTCHYPLSSIMLDKIPQSMLEQEAFAGRIDPLLRLAGSICFCEHCHAQAREDGIDLAHVQELLLALAEASRKIPQYVRESMRDDLRGDIEIPGLLLEEPELYAVLQWRIRCVVHFLEQAKALVASPQSGCKLSAALVPPVKIGHDASVPRAWLGAQSYRAFSTVLDTIHSVIHWSPDVVEYDTRRARDWINTGNPNCELCVHVAAYGSHRPDEMELLARAAVGQGADSLAFFCHDLLDERMLDTLKRVTI